MDQPIHEAIEACYVAFARRPPTSIDGCPCCTSKEELLGLLARPLRELGAREVDRYAFSAMTTIGTIDDFRYFWPRVAELAVSGQMLTDIEVVFGKLAYGRWGEWPERERVAVSMLVAALSARFGQQRLEDADSWLRSRSIRRGSWSLLAVPAGAQCRGTREPGCDLRVEPRVAHVRQAVQCLLE